MLLSPSVTVTVTVATPCRPGLSVTVTVRLEPLPPKSTSETREGLSKVAPRDRLAAGVSPSLMTKGTGGVAVFAGIVWSGIRVSVGGLSLGSLPATTSLKEVPTLRLSKVSTPMPGFGPDWRRANEVMERALVGSVASARSPVTDSEAGLIHKTLWGVPVL